MAVDDALHWRQADTRAFELGHAMQPLEGAEQLVLEGHVEAGAVVTDEKRGLAVNLRRAELDASGVVFARELPGVPQKVVQHHSQQPRVAAGSQARLDAYVYVALGPGLLQGSDDALGHGAEVDALALQPGAGHPRKAKQAIDQLGQPLAGTADTVQVVAAFVVQTIAIVLEQHLTETVHAAQGRTEIVGHRVTEGLQLLVGGFELGGALDDALLELFGELAEAILGGGQSGRALLERGMGVRVLQDLGGVARQRFRLAQLRRRDGHIAAPANMQGAPEAAPPDARRRDGRVAALAGVEPRKIALLVEALEDDGAANLQRLGRRA